MFLVAVHIGLFTGNGATVTVVVVVADMPPGGGGITRCPTEFLSEKQSGRKKGDFGVAQTNFGLRTFWFEHFLRKIYWCFKLKNDRTAAVVRALPICSAPCVLHQCTVVFA